MQAFLSFCRFLPENVQLMIKRGGKKLQHNLNKNTHAALSELSYSLICPIHRQHMFSLKYYLCKILQLCFMARTHSPLQQQTLTLKHNLVIISFFLLSISLEKVLCDEKPSFNFLMIQLIAFSIKEKASVRVKRKRQTNRQSSVKA